MNENSKIVTVPNSKESEMMVLGCMFNNTDSLSLAVQVLNNADFYFNEHKIIFQRLKVIYEKDKPADILIVAQELKQIDKLNEVGGISYLMSLAQYAGTSAYLEDYIEQLKELSMRRELVCLGIELQKQANLKENSSHIIVEIQKKIKLIENNELYKTKFPIRFLNQFENNFLLEEPAGKPMLLEFEDYEGRSIGFLPKGIVGMLVGAGGIGKTHLLAQLAISISTGTPWLDKFKSTECCGKNKKGNVFLGMGENQYDDIHRVLYKSSKKLRRIPQNLLENDILFEASKRMAIFSFCGQQAAFLENKKPSFYFYSFKQKLIELAPLEGWSLIILDPISRLLGADAEIDNAAATQFISLLEELALDLPGNPTILFSHHVNKSSMSENKKQDQTAARGSSALTDGVRWQINFAKLDGSNEENKTLLKMTKSNFTAFIPDMYLEKDLEGYLQTSKSRNIPLTIKSKGNNNDKL